MCAIADLGKLVRVRRGRSAVPRRAAYTNRTRSTSLAYSVPPYSILAANNVLRNFLRESSWQMRSAGQYVAELAAQGRYHFSTEETQRALGTSLPALRASLRRLKRRGEIADPHRGFHVIVPPGTAGLAACHPSTSSLSSWSTSQRCTTSRC